MADFTPTELARQAQAAVDTHMARLETPAQRLEAARYMVRAYFNTLRLYGGDELAAELGDRLSHEAVGAIVQDQYRREAGKR